MSWKPSSVANPPNKMRTLILIPTETEAAPLRAACPDAPVRIAGVGMAAAAAATTRIIAEEHPDRLILAGIAGASDRSVAVCEVVAVAGERIAELPGKYVVRYAADFTPAGLRTVESNTTNRTGVAASGTQIENMEGAAFLAVCRAFGVPGAEVRAVSNYTDDPRSAWRIGESAEKLAETIIRILSDKVDYLHRSDRRGLRADRRLLEKHLFLALEPVVEDSAPRGRFRRRLAAGTLRRQEKQDTARQRQLIDSMF